MSAIRKNWSTKQLVECGEIIGGGTPSKMREDYWNGHIPWISAKEMRGFEITDSELKITNLGLSESSAKMIPENSVLLVVRGSILYRHVPVAVNRIPCTINQDLKAIVPNEGIDAAFLAHMLWGANDRLQAMVEVAGNTAGKLPTAKWSTFEVPIPPMAEQHRIVARIEEMRHRVEEVRNLLEEAMVEINSFNSALLAKAFRGEL